MNSFNLTAVRVPKCRSLARGQTDFEAADVEHRPVDLALFDAGHLVECPR